VSSIREFVGALVLAGKSVGFFVSTARRFSTWAKESAERASGITLKRLELVDASKLMDILRMVSDRVEPWTKYAHSLDEKSQDFGSSREAKLFGF